MKDKIVVVPTIIPGIILQSMAGNGNLCRQESKNCRFRLTDWSVFEQTFGARSEEIQAVMLNCSRDVMSHSLVKIFLWGNLEIFYPTAMQTIKMIMFVQERIVSPRCLAKIKFANLPLVLEDAQISIDCSKRDAGHLFPHTFINPFGSRMRSCFTKYLENSFALFASFRNEGLHGIILP